MRLGLVFFVWVASSLPAADGPAADRKIDFAKDVAPIFQDHCVECHDARKQRSSFRLDVRSAAMRGGENFSPAIVPDKSADSPLLRIVSGKEDGFRMPPKGDLLSAEQIGVIKAWIDQGAHWPDALSGEQASQHWAFQPVQRSVVPHPGTISVRSPIDAFLFEKLAAQDMTFSKEADRVTLLRRLSFDLLGLPPTVEDSAEFAADERPDAYERLADRLLASPHFGERSARHWLDVVRFAESHGFEMNQHRPNAWPYRDYVIDAFNSDKPYDQFVREQIAGDVFGAETATGFLVGGPWDQVKSPDIGLTLQQRADELHDMVSTTGSTFLGLTVGCARCHNHKFDPISHVDYHAWKAALSGVQHGERPVASTNSATKKERVQELQAKLLSVEGTLRGYEPFAFRGRTIFLDDDSPEVTQLVPRRGSEPYRQGTERGQLQDPGDADRLPNLGRGYSHWNASAGQDVFAWKPKTAGRFQFWISWACGISSHARDARYLLDADGDLETKQDQTELARIDQRTFADGEGGERQHAGWSGLRSLGVRELTGQEVLVLRNGDAEAVLTADLLVVQEDLAKTESPALHVRTAVRSNDANLERFPKVQAKFVRFTVLQTSTPSEPCLDELEAWSVGDSPRNVALAEFGARPTSSGNFPDASLHQLSKIHDGKYGNSFSWISNEAGKGWVQLELPQAEWIDRVVWSRDRDTVPPHYADRTPTGYRIEISLDGRSWNVVATSWDRVPFGWTTAPVQLAPLLSGEQRRKLEALRTEQRDLQQELARLSREPLTYAGRMTVPEPIHRLQRGDPMQPREAVLPGGLAEFGPRWELAANSSDADRRRAFAEWLVDPAQPLTARVIVNRLWQQHFGQGIVATPSDFGRNGAPPTHPELLDWLAVRLVDGEWSLKALHRRMVESQAYRQVSMASPRCLERDAAARFLWRFPPRRLEAEALRDTILSLCGNLDDQMGGPGFDLFEPNGNYVKVYNSRQEFRPAEWRRMVYQSKPRMQLDDTFGSFDCPDAGQIAPKRLTSTTALQALNLLNSRFIVQQSEIFARRLEQEAGTAPAAQIRRAFHLAFFRDPDAEELTGALDLISDHGLPAFCRAILNANELLYVF